ncbi:MAG: hypothetical protein FJ100_11875 [Deltaproteobacteria bacterium]|nr:hypothetical protein [Deltaproteobacteria bacterium]
MVRGALHIVVVVAFAAAGFAAVRLARGRPAQGVDHGASLGLAPGQHVALLGDVPEVLDRSVRAGVAPGGRVVLASGTTVPPWDAGGSFDVVVLVDAPVDVRPLLAKVRACLRPGGQLIVRPQATPPEFALGEGFARAYHRAADAAATPAEAALRRALDARLSAASRAGMALWRDGPPPEVLRVLLSRDVDRVLDDRTLVTSLNDQLGARGSGVAQALVAQLPVVEARLLQWLVLAYDDAGLLDPAGAPLDARQARALRSTVRLIFSPLLGPLQIDGEFLRSDPVALLARIERSGFRRTDHLAPADGWSFAVQAEP